MMKKRYVFSVYKVFIRNQETVDTEFFTTYKEAKSYAKAYKESHADAQIVSIKQIKVHSRSGEDVIIND